MRENSLKNRLFFATALAGFLAIGTMGSALAAPAEVPNAARTNQIAQAPTPAEKAEETTELCFDPNVGRPMPCNATHTEEAKPDIPDFMTPHSGARTEKESE